MNWLVIGSRGFIGSHFCRKLPQARHIDRGQLDLCNPQVPSGCEGYHYAVIAAGMGNPVKCALNPELSYQCNVVGTLQLGKELLKRGILPIFFSSDYVFDDELQLRPLNTYGQEKLELENEATAMGALIIRLSKVYGIEKGDHTLFDEMANNLVHGRTIRAAQDQVFAPVYVGDVVDRTMELATKGIRGVATVVGPSFASRLEMARLLAQRLRADENGVKAISLDDLADGIRRPKRLALKGDFPGLSWERGIEKVGTSYGR